MLKINQGPRISEKPRKGRAGLCTFAFDEGRNAARYSIFGFFPLWASKKAKLLDKGRNAVRFSNILSIPPGFTSGEMLSRFPEIRSLRHCSTKGEMLSGFQTYSFLFSESSFSGASRGRMLLFFSNCDSLHFLGLDEGRNAVRFSHIRSLHFVRLHRGRNAVRFSNIEFNNRSFFFGASQRANAACFWNLDSLHFWGAWQRAKCCPFFRYLSSSPFQVSRRPKCCPLFKHSFSSLCGASRRATCCPFFSFVRVSRKRRQQTFEKGQHVALCEAPQSEENAYVENGQRFSRSPEK